MNKNFINKLSNPNKGMVDLNIKTHKMHPYKPGSASAEEVIADAKFTKALKEYSEALANIKKAQINLKK